MSSRAPRTYLAGVSVEGRPLNTFAPSGVLMDVPPRELDDAALVLRAREGDAEAYGILVGRYKRAAYAVALSVTKHHENAEDVAQTAFLVALRRLEDCRNPERFGGWLLSIVRNRARNLLRRENLRVTEEIPETASSRLPGPERVFERAELRGLLEDALERLTPVQREVVLLHDVQGWKHREIAERLEMPAGTVRSHLHFARKELRRILSPNVMVG